MVAVSMRIGTREEHHGVGPDRRYCAAAYPAAASELDVEIVKFETTGDHRSDQQASGPRRERRAPSWLKSAPP